jgi:outer membrane biosynthesis protein TonB
MSKRGRDSTARSSMMIAIVMHAIAFVVFFVWAAKTGRLDPILKVINVVPVAKEKPKEQPKPQPKPEETIKPEELPKIASAPPRAAPVTAPNPSASTLTAPPAAAPPPAVLPDFVFSDGAKQVISSTNAPIDLYKSLVEFAIRSNWQRPEGTSDAQYIAEAQVSIDPAGRITHYQLSKGSGDKTWDKTVMQAMGLTKSISRPPPKGFPETFTVRFDVVPDTFAITP